MTYNDTKMEECTHCHDETAEYVPNAQSYSCNTCYAHWHILALNGLHYFPDGSVHYKIGDKCYSL